MKKVLILCFLVFNFLGFSQNVQDIIDNLKLELKAKPDAKKTATIYSDLTWYYSNISIDSALVYGNKAIEYSNKIHDEKLLSQIYSDLGAVYFRKGSFEESKKNYLKASSLRTKNKDYIGVAKVNINLASILTSQQNFTEAANYYLKAISYFEKIDDTITNVVKSNLASIFVDMNNFSKAKKYVNESIDFQKKNNLDFDLTKSYLILGNIYSGENQNQNAIKYYNLSTDLAIKSNNHIGAINGYHNIGSVYLDIGNYSEAAIFYEKSKKYLNLLNSNLDRAIFEINIGQCYLLNKKFNASKEILLKNIKYLQASNSRIELSNTYKWLSKNYMYLKQSDSANYYFDKFLNLNNELLNDKNIKQTAELETKYQTAKKEKQLLEKETEAKKRNQLIIGLIVLSLFIAIIGYLIYRQQKLKNKQQIQSFELKQAINQIETQNKLQSQRLAISKDLHDNIGAQLTFIISSVETAKFAPEIENTKLGNKLTKISDFTKDTIVELRDTIWAMNSNEISFEELQSRILNFIEKANAATENIDFKFNIDQNLNDIKLTSIAGMNIYRTIQEAINNSLKYANASKITVDIKKLNDKIEIEIIDNGLGFDKENSIVGNGLSNMQKRIEEIDGTFNLSSIVKQGTQIKIIIDNKSEISVL